MMVNCVSYMAEAPSECEGFSGNRIAFSVTPVTAHCAGVRRQTRSEPRA